MAIERRIRLTRPFAAEPVDPDIESPGRLRIHPDLVTVLAVMTGGILGAVARYAATLGWPTTPGEFPGTTFGINLLGSLLLAVLAVLSTERWPDVTLLRPLLGTGVIGGFTTFSTFAVDQRRLLAHGHAGTAVAYLAATLSMCAVATWLGEHLTRAALGRRR